MQNAKPTTRFLFLLTAYRLLPTAYWLLASAQPRPRTPVDIRSKNAQKLLTFGLVQIRRFSGNSTDDERALTVQGSQRACRNDSS